MSLRHGGLRSEIFGGLRPSHAHQVYRAAMRTDKARKNLFLVRCWSWVGGDVSRTLNLYALEVEHGMGEVSGSPARAGAVTVDLLERREAGTLRITTLDDPAGTLKYWFEAHIAAIAMPNGTFGVPARYAIEIQVEHAVMEASFKAYCKRGLYRAQSCETGLSRREDGLVELTMTFTSLDPFM